MNVQPQPSPWNGNPEEWDGDPAALVEWRDVLATDDKLCERLFMSKHEAYVHGWQLGYDAADRERKPSPQE